MDGFCKGSVMDFMISKRPDFLSYIFRVKLSSTLAHKNLMSEIIFMSYNNGRPHPRTILKIAVGLPLWYIRCTVSSTLYMNHKSIT